MNELLGRYETFTVGNPGVTVADSPEWGPD